MTRSILVVHQRYSFWNHCSNWETKPWSFVIQAVDSRREGNSKDCDVVVCSYKVEFPKNEVRGRTYSFSSISTVSKSIWTCQFALGSLLSTSSKRGVTLRRACLSTPAIIIGGSGMRREEIPESPSFEAPFRKRAIVVFSPPT